MSEWHGLPTPDLSRHGFSARIIEPAGNGSSRIMLLGEAPGEIEDASGIPFHPKAPAGAMLNRLLTRSAFEREQFRIVNTVWQRPPRNWLEGSPWETEAVEAYRPFVAQAVAEHQPRVIVALGNVALRALTVYGGKGTGISNVQGYVCDSPFDGVWVVPTFHPSGLIQGLQGLSGIVIWALLRAQEIVKDGFVRKPTRYITRPSLDDFLAFERGYDPTRHSLSYDIETPESGTLSEEDLTESDDEDDDEPAQRDISYTIIRASLCYDAENGYAVSVPWQPPYIDIYKRMLASSGPKNVWNGGFDDPRLEAAGAPINGKKRDFMWLWKHLQPSLPTKLKCRSLEFVTPFYGWSGEAWKNLSSSEPEYYSCCDAHALQQNADGIERDLRAKGMWERYEDHVTVLMSDVLRPMAATGLPYSKEQAAAFEIELQQKFDERMATLQQRVPDDIKPSKQKTGYKLPPKDTTGLARRKFKVLWGDLRKDEYEHLFRTMERTGDTAIGDQEIAEIERWCLLEPFLPTSPMQVKALIKSYGHKVATARKSRKETSDDESLRKLIKKCKTSRKTRDHELAELLQMCRECRKLSKVLGTYVRGWQPGPDGRIHSTPGYWGSMYRISWRRPNVSATIQDKSKAVEDTIARGFRKCVQARAGHVLLEADWKGIEAVIVGWFAGDPTYMRLARLGVHDYMTFHMLVRKGRLLTSDLPDLSWDDAKLSSYLKRAKKEWAKERDDAKHTVHGANYGMGANLLSDLYELPISDAKWLLDFYFDLFPKISAWQDATMKRASKEARLTNPWGYSMNFWDVYTWDAKRYERLTSLWAAYQRNHGAPFRADQLTLIEQIKEKIAAGMGMDKAISEMSWGYGKDADSSISFLPRDTAAGMLRELLLRLERKHDFASNGIMLVSNHDAVLTEPTLDDLERVATILKTEMEAPVAVLGGLTVDVEMKVGECWHEDAMETYTLREVIA